jgi:uncharacterized protein (TIGR02246 family)
MLECMTDREAIVELIRTLDEAWRRGNYDDLAALVTDDVVIVPPGFSRRVVGRDAFVESYREFGTQTRIERYELGTPQIEVCGHAAVATARFEMSWWRGDELHHEHGHELIALAHSVHGWRIFWRTLVS